MIFNVGRYILWNGNSAKIMQVSNNHLQIQFVTNNKFYTVRQDSPLISGNFSSKERKHTIYKSRRTVIAKKSINKPEIT